MKNQHVKILVIFLCSYLVTQYAQAQPPPCPLNFGNGLYCNQTVDISWYYVDQNNSMCGNGSTTVPSGGSFALTCTGCTAVPLKDLVIIVTAVNGCPISSVTMSWLVALANPTGTGIGSVPITCPCSGAPIPPQTYCCDSGTSLLIFAYGTPNPVAGVN